MTNIDPESLRANTRVCDALYDLCDFNLEFPGDIVDSSEIKVGGFVSIASDGAGGAFLLGASGYLLYVTSEGAAGVIAASLLEGLQLMVAYPDWYSLLKYSGGGDITQMRRVARRLEKSYLKNDPDVESSLSFLKSELSLPEASDPVASLHHAVKGLSPSVEFYLSEGEHYGSLFNTFTEADRR